MINDGRQSVYAEHHNAYMFVRNPSYGESEYAGVRHVVDFVSVIRAHYTHNAERWRTDRDQITAAIAHMLYTAWVCLCLPSSSIHIIRPFALLIGSLCRPIWTNVSVCVRMRAGQLCKDSSTYIDYSILMYAAAFYLFFVCEGGRNNLHARLGWKLFCEWLIASS